MIEPQEAAETPQKLTEIHVMKEKLLGLRVSEILKKMHSGVGEPESTSRGHKTVTMHKLTLETTRSGKVGGLRTYLPQQIGKGYWDFIKLSPGIFASITDATYFKPHRLELPAEQILKIRVICSGALSFPHEKIRLSDESSTIQFIVGNKPIEYIVQPHLPLRMVVLHALPDALGDLGITDDMLPEPVRPHTKSLGKALNCFSIGSSTKLIRIAKEMITSRDNLPNRLRPTYIRAKAQELFCETFIQTKPAINIMVAGNRIRQSDIPRFHEAKRVLVNNLESSPTIEQLSRLVGINRTKLKAGFRELFGETIQEYRTRVRLAEARRLIEETELQMAEIGRKIGFNHAANFTQTIKRHFGLRPLELRKRYTGQPL